MLQREGSGVQDREQEPPTIAIADLEFVHQYLTKTCPTLTFAPEALSTWQDFIFEVSLSHKFVLHGIIATAALHKAVSEAPSSAIQQRYRETALRNQNIALSLFIPILNSPDSQNSVALCSFSMLLSILTLGSRSLPESLTGVMHSLAQVHESDTGAPNPHSSISTLIDVMVVLQGTHTLIKETYKWLENTKFGGLLRGADFDSLPEISADAARTLDLLSARVKLLPQNSEPGSTSGQSPRELYEHEITNLWKVCKCTQTEEWYQNLLSWPTVIKREFVVFLRARERLGLAMVAFWAACFHTLNDRWWAKGWSVSLVEEVSRFLSAEWEDVLRWPRSVVGLSV